MVSLSPGAKGDDGEVSSFKRPEVKWREILCWLEAESRPGRAFLGQDLSVLLGCTGGAREWGTRLKMWERRRVLGKWRSEPCREEEGPAGKVSETEGTCLVDFF